MSDPVDILRKHRKAFAPQRAQLEREVLAARATLARLEEMQAELEAESGRYDEAITTLSDIPAARAIIAQAAAIGASPQREE